MQVFKGLPVSPGIVVGKVLVIDDDLRRVTRRQVRSGMVKSELARLDAALKASIDELDAVYAKAKEEMGANTANIFLFHKGMLADKSLVNPIRAAIEKEQLAADYAVSQAFTTLADKFRSNPDSVFATKVNDVEDLAHRVLHHLGVGSAAKAENADKGTIIIARDLTPSQTAGFDRRKILGFATDLGGKTSHTAIIAKALEIPAVVGCQTLLRFARDGMMAVLDGDEGLVALSPDEATLARYERELTRRKQIRVSLSGVAQQPAVTRDGQHVKVLANIEFADEVATAIAQGAEGVGLYRTEYLYLTSSVEPTEEVHYKAYKRCVELCAGKELTIRTVDLGADKYTQSREEIPERNPFLGCRSIRYCLRSLPMFKRQLRP